MKNTVKLSVLLVSILALAAGASATTITLASSPGTTNYVGYVATNPYAEPAANNTFDNSQLASGSGAAAIAVTNPGGWSSALTGSVWISNVANSGPTEPDYVAPYGYYTYTETFIDPGDTTIASGSLSIMADDTAAVLLNGTLIAGYESLGDDSHCATGGAGISCGGSYTFNLGGMNLVYGINTLTIVDLQAGTGGTGDAAGIDYYGTITTAPEPRTWALLGSGLLGLMFLTQRQAKPSVIHNVRTPALERLHGTSIPNTASRPCNRRPL